MTTLTTTVAATAGAARFGAGSTEATAVQDAREIRVQSPDVVRRAVRLLEAGSGDFSDAVIVLLGTEAG